MTSLRSTRTLSLPEVLVVIGMAAAIGLILWGLFGGERPKLPTPHPALRSVTDLRDVREVRFSYIVTIEHDHHLFVTTDARDSAILHHPDCPCLKPAVKTAAPTP